MMLAVDHAIDPRDGYHLTADDVHDTVLADAQPAVPVPVERLRGVKVVGQGGDSCTDGVHAVLVSHVTTGS
jgi:hypothetical protein